MPQWLAAKKLIKDPDCPRCGSGKETINHILFECGFARLAWATSPLSFLFFPYPTSSLFTNLAPCLLPQGIVDSDHRDRFKSWPWLLWRIWKARNEFCINNYHEEVQKLTSLAAADAKGWEIANCPLVSTSQVSTSPLSCRQVQHCPKTWKKPPSCSLKCNIDGSWKHNSHTSGVGWVLRNELGRTRWSGSKTYPALDSPLQVEAAALVWAMNVLDNLHFTYVIFEMDCRELLLVIKKPLEWPKLMVFLDEIAKNRSALRPSFQTCAREANISADLLAKTARPKQVYSANVDYGISPNAYHFLCTLLLLLHML